MSEEFDWYTHHLDKHPPGLDDKHLCSRCKINPASEPHQCPYACEINDDCNDEYCTCCPSCTEDCAMDI